MKKVAKTVGVLGLVGCSVMGSQLAVAADSGWIFGMSGGQSRAKIDDVKITSQLLGVGLTPTAITDNDRHTAYKIFGGYKFNKYFALESGYFDLGEFGYSVTTAPAGTLNGNIKLKGWNFDAVGMLPITEKFSAFGRAGANYAEARDNFSSTGAVSVPATLNASKNTYNYKAGLGVQYDFTESIGLRGEVERYRINDAVNSRGDVDMLSVGLVVALGGKKSAAPPVAAKETKAEEPAVMMVVVPVTVKTQKYCTILDIQFEIKQNEIQQEEKEKLNVVGVFMNKYPETIAVIEGHSDDVGTDEFNLKLSQKRAESVVSYLKDSYHIAPSRLTAVGYGASRPIADNSTKEGKQANRRISAVIACATDVEGLRVAAARLTVAMEIEFDPYKTDIAPEYFDELAKVANFMKVNPTVTASVEGHADRFVGIGANKERVSAKESTEISGKRAQSVVNFLVEKQGIARSRFTTAEFGATRRLSYGTTLEGQQQNRRVNIIFKYAK